MRRSRRRICLWYNVFVWSVGFIQRAALLQTIPTYKSEICVTADIDGVQKNTNITVRFRTVYVLTKILLLCRVCKCAHRSGFFCTVWNKLSTGAAVSHPEGRKSLYGASLKKCYAHSLLVSYLLVQLLWQLIARNNHTPEWKAQTIQNENLQPI